MKLLTRISRPAFAVLLVVLVSAGTMASPVPADSGVSRIKVRGHELTPSREVDEVEPNDSTGAAQDVGEPDVSINTSIFFQDIGECGEPGGCKQGPDYFAFTIGAESDVTIYGLQPDPDFTYFGTLYGPGGETLASIANGEIRETLQPGRYVFSNAASRVSANLAGIVFNILILATPKNSGPSDVALVVSSTDGPAVSGAPLTLSVTAANIGRKAASALVTTSVPAGTTLATATTTRGSLTAPAAGHTGPITLSVTLGEGEQATATLVLNVTAAPGATLSASANVELSTGDTNPSNNTVSGSVTVIAGSSIQLSFNAPTGAGLAPPTDLIATAVGEGKAIFEPTAKTGPPIGYRVYRSPQPNVQPTPGNLLTQLGSAVTSLVTQVSGAGTFFTVTAVYADGESPKSNEAQGVVTGPSVNTVIVSSKKVTATGSSFTGAFKIYINGLAFSTAPTIKKAGAKLVQKGTLANGAALSSVARSGSFVIVTVQGPNGGMTIRPVQVK